MKKILLILVAVIGFAFSANAQNYVKVTKVHYNSATNKIEVTVELTNEGLQKCESVNFKVTPANNPIATLLNDGVQYDDFRSSYGGDRNRQATVYFGCGENDRAKAQQCRMYDFNAVTTDFKLR